MVVESDKTQCKYLYTYKPKLYKMYKRQKYDVTSEIEEEHARYAELDEEKVYMIKYLSR